jgi:hypothetical protein
MRSPSPDSQYERLAWVELGRSQWIDRLCVFCVRMAGSAPHFGKTVCPAVGLSIGGIGATLKDSALIGCKCLWLCQISNVLGFGAPLTRGIGNADR